MSDQHQEGWEAPFRGPLIATVALLTLLLGSVVLFGSIYRHTIQRKTHAPVLALRSLPRPQLETIQTPPGQHRADFHQPPPATIARAMAQTAARGDALWAAQP